MTTEITVINQITPLKIILDNSRLSSSDRHLLAQTLLENFPHTDGITVGHIADEIGKIVDRPDGSTQIESKSTIFHDGGSRANVSYRRPFIFCHKEVTMLPQGFSHQYPENALIRIRNY